jgi:hypothetical protein
LAIGAGDENFGGGRKKAIYSKQGGIHSPVWRSSVRQGCNFSGFVSLFELPARRPDVH